MSSRGPDPVEGHEANDEPAALAVAEKKPLSERLKFWRK
jgi:hypothetical protein